MCLNFKIYLVFYYPINKYKDRKSKYLGPEAPNSKDNPSGSFKVYFVYKPTFVSFPARTNDFQVIIKLYSLYRFESKLLWGIFITVIKLSPKL